jgi:hypothetical protein
MIIISNIPDEELAARIDNLRKWVKAQPPLLTFGEVKAEVRSCWPDLTEAEVALIAFEAVLSDEEPPERPKGRPILGR